jgi:SNF2 family DNA or RNA helicase
LVAACNAEQFDGNASVAEGLKKLGLTAQRQRLPGMEVALMPHQTIGVAWMLDKEKDAFQGGCLSDEMGLGKVNDHFPLVVCVAC